MVYVKVTDELSKVLNKRRLTCDTDQGIEERERKRGEARMSAIG